MEQDIIKIINNYDFLEYTKNKNYNKYISISINIENNKSIIYYNIIEKLIFDIIKKEFKENTNLLLDKIETGYLLVNILNIKNLNDLTITDFSNYLGFINNKYYYHNSYINNPILLKNKIKFNIIISNNIITKTQILTIFYNIDSSILDNKEPIINKIKDKPIEKLEKIDIILDTPHKKKYDINKNNHKDKYKIKYKN